MIIDEAIRIYQEELKEFFSNPEIQKLLNQNNFEELYNQWDRFNFILTALLLKSGIDFLPYMTVIPYGCFNRLDIQSIIIPNNVKSIEDGLFKTCSKLTNVTIPNSIERIGGYAFEGCDNLTSINYQGTKDQWDKIYKHIQWDYGSSIKTIHCTDGIIILLE